MLRSVSALAPPEPIPDHDRPLVVRGLTKTFGAKRKRRVPALRGVSFDVEPGSIYGLIGANGSGKSTLIRTLSTLVLADAGEVRVFGYDVVRDSMAARRLINRVSADPSFFRQLSALQNLQFYGRIYGMDPAAVRVRAPAILDRLHLDAGHQQAMVKELSRGQQQKIAVARAFLTSPVLMLLDEPTTGLDPRSRRDVQVFIREVQRDHEATIFLTTHDMREAEALCDRIAFLVGGRIVAEGTPEELRRLVANGRPLETIDMEDVFMELTGRRVDEDEEEDGDHE